MYLYRNYVIKIVYIFYKFIEDINTRNKVLIKFNYNYNKNSNYHFEQF